MMTPARAPLRKPIDTLGRAAFVVLGCAKNEVEAESMSSRLASLGWEMTADIPNASVVVVHTCGFLEAARKEALDTVAGVRKAAPRSFLVMSGCFSQYLGGKKPKGVDAVIGTGELDLLPALLAKRSRAEPRMAAPSGHHDAVSPRPLRAGQLAAYLRISEGCNHRCSFCVIPQLRGNLKSRLPEDIFREGRGLVQRGVRELTIISQDTSDYGGDLTPPVPLSALVRHIAGWDDLAWLRLLYVYPSEVGEDLVDLVAGEAKLCRYLDMPLQHIADSVLVSMKRDWGEKKTRALVEKLHKRVPGLALRTTFIVGYPGETEADFRRLLAFVEEGHFEHVGAFPYSLENRSPSAKLADLVPPEVGEERWTRLIEAQTKVFEKRARSRAGREIEVLIEADARGRWVARGAHQALEVDGEVRLPAYPDAPGFYRARLTGSEGPDLTGELVKGRAA